MERKKYILSFPSEIVEIPITHTFMSRFGLWTNILRAKIEPSSGGKLVIELRGDGDMIESAVRYAEAEGVTVRPLEHDVAVSRELCVDCGACVSICPSQALSLDPCTFRLVFEPDKCVVCGSCAEVCPVAAIRVDF